MSLHWRDRLAPVVRLVAAACAVFAVLVLFQQPLRSTLAPALGPGGSRVLGGLLAPSSAPGFMVQVVSEPPGAAIRIAGVDRGPSPFLGNVVCRQGQEVEITVAKAGYPTWRRTVPCREGGSLEVRARLGG